MRTHSFSNKGVKKPAKKELVVTSLLSFFSTFGWPVEAWSRMATLEDAPYRVLEENVRIDVDAEGRTRVRTTVAWEVLKEEARTVLSQRRFVYNSRASRFRVLSAETQIAAGKRRIPVRRSQIQDKPLASSRDGFDQQNQVTVAFPSVEKGSQIRIAYEQRLLEPAIPGSFSQSFVFGLGEYTEKTKVEIISPKLPLHFQENDPNEALEVKQTPGKLTLELKRPVYFYPLEEPEAHLHGRQLVWVDVSTHQQWPSLVGSILPSYVQRLRDPLPPHFAQIKEDVLKLQLDSTAQVNEVLSRLSAHLHYFGDWRPVRGGHIPRSLREIGLTRYGDCKDLSLSLAAILRQMGFQAHLAWVKRSLKPVFSPHSLPVESAFNHAIVYAQKDGRAFWLDPTNRAAIAEDAYEDILNREALILDPGRVRLEKIGAQGPEASVTQYMAEIQTFQKHTETHARLDLKGRATLPYTGEELIRSRDAIDYRIVSRFADETRLLKWNFDPYSLKERIASPLHFRFLFSESGSDLQTSLGYAQYLPTSPLIRKVMIEPRDRVSGVFLGQPNRWDSTVLVRGVEDPGALGSGCEVSSPWMRLKRSYRKQRKPDAGVLVMDQVDVLQTEILAHEVQSPEFLEFRNQVRDCFDRKALIVERVSPLSESETIP
jgi:hypothetical protein